MNYTRFLTLDMWLKQSTISSFHGRMLALLRITWAFQKQGRLKIRHHIIQTYVDYLMAIWKTSRTLLRFVSSFINKLVSLIDIYFIFCFYFLFTFSFDFENRWELQGEPAHYFEKTLRIKVTKALENLHAYYEIWYVFAHIAFWHLVEKDSTFTAP